MIMDFEYYVKSNLVRRVSKNPNRAKSLIKKAKERLKAVKKIEKPSFKLEFIHEAIIEMIEAILAARGFKSYSHEADIAFLRKLGVSERIIKELDELRWKRHRSKYYGVEFGERDVEKANQVLKIVVKELKKFLPD